MQCTGTERIHLSLFLKEPGKSKRITNSVMQLSNLTNERTVLKYACSLQSLLGMNPSLQKQPHAQ